MIKILFVCHGNICRSPMAEFIMKDLVKQAGEEDLFQIASAATSTEELGNPVYPPARRKLNEHGLSCSGHAAHQMTKAEYNYYDYIICMDHHNVRNLQYICKDTQKKVHLLMEYAGSGRDVADPWYTGNFDDTWEDCLAGCKGLLSHLHTVLGNPRHPEGDFGGVMLSRMNESHAPVTEWALGFAHVPTDGTTLDIGCGGGATLARLSDMVPQGFAQGVDYSEVAVKESTVFNQSRENVSVQWASVETLPFSDQTFDLITTVESFYFWPDPISNVMEVCRVLKTGGQFLLIADVYDDGNLDWSTQQMVAEYNMNNPTPEEFENLFRAAGFSRVLVHLKPGTPWICVEGIK